MLGMLSVTSNFLITYSSILNLKYCLNHYELNDSKVRTTMNYLTLTFVGPLITVFPVELLEFVRVIVKLIVTIATCSKEQMKKAESTAYDFMNFFT